MPKILVVEDEPTMAMGLKDNLEFENYTVETVANGNDGLNKIRDVKFDLVLLDVMLPGISGFDICKTIRKEGIKTPIILLTAKGEEIDKVLGLELGADDYITKPFSVRELLARVKAVLRRSSDIIEDGNKQEIIIGKLSVNFASYNANENGNEVLLSYKEFEILHFLWERKNQTVSRDELLKNVWGDDIYITTRTIDNFVLKLRQKIETDSKQPKIILTVHGIGYKLIN